MTGESVFSAAPASHSFFSACTRSIPRLFTPALARTPPGATQTHTRPRTPPPLGLLPLALSLCVFFFRADASSRALPSSLSQ